MSEGRRSFGRGGEEACDDPVASSVMGVEGVVGVMLMEDWLTVLKAPEAILLIPITEPLVELRAISVITD